MYVKVCCLVSRLLITRMAGAHPGYYMFPSERTLIGKVAPKTGKIVPMHII
jgi:hypothetical protein